MGRTALSAEDHAAFRRSMREVATKRFAKHGHAGVTMRALAEDLGCSPMTPYRYFRDKDEILDEVRLAAIEAFVVAQERAFARERAPLRRLRTMARAYVAYAVDHPDQYRVMFQVEYQADRPPTPEHVALQLRGWKPMRDTFAEAIERGELAGDPDEVAHICWASLHGLVTLHLAGKLRLGRALDSLVDPVIDHLIAGAASNSRPKQRHR
ncbi:MAG: TetR/AcrR family transcriptional regulator [Kofleriaceae bacterium]